MLLCGVIRNDSNCDNTRLELVNQKVNPSGDSVYGIQYTQYEDSISEEI